MEHIDFRDQIAKNKRKSFFLMIFVSVILILLGYVISLAFDPAYTFIILTISIIFSISYTIFGYYNSDKIAINSVGAKLANRSDYSDYYRLVEGLTMASGLPMPKLYVMNSKEINAFASGRNPKNAVLCVTEGALNKLERRELEGVLAHELGHISNYDIRYITLVGILVGMISIISEMFLRGLWFRNSDDNKGQGFIILIGIILAILAPIVVGLVQLSISRKREYSADATAVKFTRNPNGLIGALEKIRDENPPDKKISKAVAPLFFASPLKNLTSTHPPIEDRIKALKSM